MLFCELVTLFHDHFVISLLVEGQLLEEGKEGESSVERERDKVEKRGAIRERKRCGRHEEEGGTHKKQVRGV